MHEHIIAASDGTPACAGALRLALALGERDGVPVTVVALARDEPLVAKGSWLHGFSTDRARDQRDRLSAVVRQQIWDAGASGVATLIHVTMEDAGCMLAQLARERHCELLVLGGGGGGGLERGCWLGGESVMRLAVQVGLPVLAVPARERALPRSAIVGQECPQCARAGRREENRVTLRAAARLVGAGGEIRRLRGAGAGELLHPDAARGADLLVAACHCEGPIWVRSGALPTTLLRSTDRPVLFTASCGEPAGGGLAGRGSASAAGGRSLALA